MEPDGKPAKLEISNLPNFNVPEVSQYLRRSPGAIRNMVLRRLIPFRKPAGRLIFSRQEIDRWIRSAEGVSLEELGK